MASNNDEHSRGSQAAGFTVSGGCVGLRAWVYSPVLSLPLSVSLGNPSSLWDSIFLSVKSVLDNLLGPIQYQHEMMKRSTKKPLSYFGVPYPNALWVRKT